MALEQCRRLQGDLQRLSRALDRYFAGQAVRQLRYQVQQPEEGNEDRRSLGLGLRSGWAKEGAEGKRWPCARLYMRNSVRSESVCETLAFISAEYSKPAL